MVTKIKNRIRSFGINQAEEPEWQLAIRKKSEKDLIDGNYSDFLTVKNGIRYWYADPFFYENETGVYLFAEMYDRFCNKGSIGVAKIKNGKVSKFKKCIEQPFHMSYPCIFKNGRDVVIIPETYQAKSILKYSAVKFPLVWKNEGELFSGFAVDTTPIPNTNAFLTTLFQGLKPEINDNLHLVSLLDKSDVLVYFDNLKKRCAGHFFEKNNSLYRPSQNCERSYGGSLIINKVLDTSLNSYLEEFYCEIVPDNINFSNKSRRNYCGIHTYNICSKYEVIDLSYKETKKSIIVLINLTRYFYNHCRDICDLFSKRRSESNE